MNRATARQGFALITAVIISAAILATIVGIATLTVKQGHVQAAQGASDQALVVAERGLADVVSRFKATDQSFAKGVISLDASVPSDGGTVIAGNQSFYWVKIVPQGTPGTTRDYKIYAAGFIVGENISGKNSGQLKALAADPTKILARRVVEVISHGSIGTETVITTTTIPGVTTTTTTENSITTPGTGGGTTAFDWGVFSGASIQVSGNSNLCNGMSDGTLKTSGVFATTTIVASGNSNVSTPLYAKSTITTTGNSNMGAMYPNSQGPRFPSINLDVYMNLFDDFVAGTAPFDGSKTGYPDLSKPAVRSVVLTALGNPQNNTATVDGVSHHFVTPGKAASYAASVAAKNLTLSTDVRNALYDTLSQSVFYVRNTASDANATWSGQSNVVLGGVLVCVGKDNATGSTGNVTFSGNSNVAFAIAGKPFAVLAGGTVTLSGNSNVQGIFYAKGADVNGQSFAGGQSNFTGQLICQNKIQLSSSSNDRFVNYASLSPLFGNLLPGGSFTTPPTYTTTTTTTDPTTQTVTTTVIKGFASFSQTASGWTEKAWSDFPAL